MEQRDLILEMVEFLNDNGQYYSFVEFCQERGYSENDVENAIMKAEQ